MTSRMTLNLTVVMGFSFLSPMAGKSGSWVSAAAGVAPGLRASLGEGVNDDTPECPGHGAVVAGADCFQLLEILFFQSS